MALCRVTNAVYTFYNCIQCGVISYCCVRTVEVIIYGSGQPYAAKVIIACKIHGTGKRAISANYNECINTFFLYILISLVLSFLRYKLFRTGCLQYRTALHYNSRYILSCKRFNLVLNKAVITSVNTLDIKAFGNSSACNCPDCCIHSRCISTRSQHTYRLYLIHNLQVIKILRICFCHSTLQR